MSAIVTLKKGEGRTIKAGGAWIFDNEIDTITGRFKNGEVVTVHDFDGYPMGKGFINQNSKIRVRMMTRKPEQEIDDAFLTMRVKNAWEYRKTTVDTSSCRIIFGEADFLPGLVIDKYEDVLVVECLALGMEQFKEKIVNFLKQILAEDGIKIRGVYERSDANERTKEAFHFPFNSILMRGFISGIDYTIEEAAQIDGCSRLGAIRHVLLPILKPGIATIAAYGFISCWNEFLFSFMFISKQAKLTLPVGLKSLVGEFSINYGQLAAGAIIAVVPTLILFSYVQKNLVGGLSSGAVKG